MDEPLKKEVSIYSFIRAELGGLFLPTDRLCFVAIPQGGGKGAKKCVAEHYFGMRNELLKSENLSLLRRRNNSGFSLYFSICPLRSGATRRRSEDVADICPAVWADFDVPTPAMEAFLAGKSYADVPVPDLAVSTSAGRWQFFWKKPNMPTADAIKEVREIAKKTGADIAVADPARVLRLPGFQNRKPGRYGWDCRAYKVQN